jgi:hypothetical protein
MCFHCSKFCFIVELCLPALLLAITESIRLQLNASEFGGIAACIGKSSQLAQVNHILLRKFVI